MRFVFAVFVSTMLLVASDKAAPPQASKEAPPKAKKPVPPQVKKQAAQQEQKQAPAEPAKLIKPLEIPPGAVEGEPGRFTYTDAQGKKWIYAKTPFGTARYEDKPPDADAPKPIDPMANVKVTEQGDVVKFERPGPFGIYRWQKKQAELDEKERAALTKARNSAAKQEPRQESKQD